MAAKVALASVSYGIGVQNRYSAFLEDEDGFAIPSAAAINAAKQRADQAAHQKQKNVVIAGKNNSLAGKMNNRSSTNKQDNSHKGAQTGADQKPSLDGKRQLMNKQHQQASNGIQALGKQSNHTRQGNNQNSTASNRFSRNSQQQNSNHQSNVSQQPQLNKENDNSGKFVRNNNLRANNRRQFYNDEKRGQPDAGRISSLENNNVANSEEEKRRRQQKRALDLKHKDPEKREARRQQMGSSEQAPISDQVGGERNVDERGQKNRRQFGDGTGPRGQEEGSRVSRGSTGGGRGRGIRDQGAAGSATVGERRDGQQSNRLPRGPTDKPPRNRNGFGAGSRGSRGSKGDDQGRGFARDSEKQKPIPNFSNTLDFPSLAS